MPTAAETDPAAEVAAWAASGAMALTGRPDGPALGPPTGLVPALGAVASALAAATARVGRRVDVDPLRLLAERAAIAGFHRQGTTSCGGATRLLPVADGWLAVSLARPEDVELIPAWLGRGLDLASHPSTAAEADSSSEPPPDPWAAVGAAVASCEAAELVARGRLLGLPVAALGEAAPPSSAHAAFGSLPARATLLGSATPAPALEGVRVVDLGSLWAAPLAGSLLVAAGADVVKVESVHRPDGARSGPAEFFDLVNAGKRSVALDLRTAPGRRHLAGLVATADVVLEASRPRALQQLGIDAVATVADGRPVVWASITGHGRVAAPDRVAFGDDAAVAGGLVAWDDVGPCFCADAVADPITGLVTATAVVEALAAGGRWLLDVSMAGVAAHLAGPTLPVPPGLEAAAPVARTALGRAPDLGAHTDEVLTERGAG